MNDFTNMFDKQDIAILKGMFHDQKIEMRDEIHSCIAASEARMMARMDKLHATTTSDIVDFIDQAIIPQINDLHAADARIRKFVGMT